MKTFTGWQYLLIDVANHWGLDKEVFEKRIEWVENNLENLEQLAEDRGYWKDYPLFIKGVMAIREAQAGKDIGHMVAMDAVCSGMQIMSVVTGCEKGALVTGLVDPDVRADAYTSLTGIMSSNLGCDFSAERPRVKGACMTSLYGSKKEPIKAFGEDTPELQAFYNSMFEMAPGACELLAALLASWQPGTLMHEWTLPDGFKAKVKVMVQKKARLEVSEIKSSFTYVWSENEPVERDVKNAANVVHSIDAYVLRSLVRRCSYDTGQVERGLRLINAELVERTLDGHQPAVGDCSSKLGRMIRLYENTQMPDVLILECIDIDQLRHVGTEHLIKLARICREMLEHKPFEIITIHDDFKCHPNNMNALRKHYRNILADLADADYLSSLFSELHGTQGSYIKKSQDLSKSIRQSNYALT